ncbi:MAG: DeoR family transcriptional regulator [Synergistaceae bacterium]|nr:DeoR family transcriptional regulator [Synergistaceae bacterium]
MSGKRRVTALCRGKNPVSPKIRQSKGVGKASGIILDACRERSSITIPELAALAAVTERSVQRNIRKLQKSGLLRRVGGRKEGRWEVLA